MVRIPTFSKSFAVFSPMPFKVSMDWSFATCFTLLFILSYGAVRSTLRECRKFPAFCLTEKAASSGLLTKGSSFSVVMHLPGIKHLWHFPLTLQKAGSNRSADRRHLIQLHSSGMSPALFLQEPRHPPPSHLHQNRH